MRWRRGCCQGQHPFKNGKVQYFTGIEIMDLGPTQMPTCHSTTGCALVSHPPTCGLITTGALKATEVDSREHYLHLSVRPGETNMCVASALISVTTDVSATGDLLVTSWHETSLQEWVRGQRNKGQLAMHS